MALRHQVFFWLANPDSDADRARLIAGLEAMRAIPLIRELYVGVPAHTEERPGVDGSFSVSELMVFDSFEDQAAYQAHPLHRKFVEEHEHLWVKHAVYDTIDA